jgi:hypothetical protein
VKFSRLKFYKVARGTFNEIGTMHGGGAIKAVVFFPNSYGASIYGRDENDIYDLSVLIATKPRSKGNLRNDADFAYNNPLGQYVFYNQTRDDVERLLDEIAAFTFTNDVVDRMVVAIYGASPGDWIRGGSLYGGSTSDSADDPQYWLPLRIDREPYALYFATKVPERLAERVEAQNTRDQYFGDGYEALAAIRPYLDREPFYESPKSWATEQEEEQEEQEEED